MINKDSKTYIHAGCHPSKEHHAKGLCKSCYETARASTHREETRARSRIYYAAHKEKVKTHNTAYATTTKLEVLNHYGGPVCACCGETLFEGLTIDHIEGHGNAHRKQNGPFTYRWLKKNNYPPGYQVLCATCNMAKGRGNHCPHQDISGEAGPGQNSTR